MNRFVRLMSLFAAASILVLAAGCGGSGSASSSALPEPSGQYQALKFAVTTDKSDYTAGETVTATLAVTNTGSQTLSYTMVYGGEGLIVGQSSAEVWNSTLHGATTGDKLFNQSIAPGQTITYGSIQWNQTYDNGSAAPAGQYTLVGWTQDEFYNTGNEPYSWFPSNFGATATITVQ